MSHHHVLGVLVSVCGLTRFVSSESSLSVGTIGTNWREVQKVSQWFVSMALNGCEYADTVTSTAIICTCPTSLIPSPFPPPPTPLPPLVPSSSSHTLLLLSPPPLVLPPPSLYRVSAFSTWRPRYRGCVDGTCPFLTSQSPSTSQTNRGALKLSRKLQISNRYHTEVFIMP